MFSKEKRWRRGGVQMPFQKGEKGQFISGAKKQQAKDTAGKCRPNVKKLMANSAVPRQMCFYK